MKTTTDDISGHADSNTTPLPNDLLLGEAERILSEGHQVELKATGSSMRPFIIGGRDSVIIAPLRAETRPRGSEPFTAGTEPREAEHQPAETRPRGSKPFTAETRPRGSKPFAAGTEPRDAEHQPAESQPREAEHQPAGTEGGNPAAEGNSPAATQGKGTTAQDNASAATDGTTTELQPLKVGRIVLAHLPDGGYVLHRIRSISGENVVLMGDGNLRKTESCRLSDIKGIATAIIRKGRRIDCNSKSEQRKAGIWSRLLPIRRPLLYIYRNLSDPQWSA